MDRFEKCEISAHLFANLLVSAEGSLIIQEVNNSENINAPSTMKEEKELGDEGLEQQLSPSASDGSSRHSNSVIYCDVPDSEFATTSGEE
jgi:hypothetical protein